ncbi:MAG: phosphodiester glycosidase family protein, partial [Myxococcales bacterium]|nr:phosphodiester glycosidase family protein [Myxococcales bacterium]
MPDALKDLAFVLMGWLLTPLGLAAGLGARALVRRARGRRGGARALRLGPAVLLALLCPLALGLGAYGLWIRYRPHPSPAQRVLHPGIAYRVFGRHQPRPIVVHVVTVDLDTPGLSLVPSPPSAVPGCLPAQTGSAFLAQHHVQLALNTHFFYPCPGQPAPEELEPGQLLRPVGVYAVGGASVMPQPWNGATVYFGADGSVSLHEPPVPLHHAISGRQRLVEAGRATDADDALLAPRIALGFDRTRRRMTVVLVDGRQRGYSEGLSLPEMSALLVELGLHDAIELDGGGSATLVTEGQDGAPEVLNSPIHRRIPGRERPVAAHLGV